MRLTLLLCFMLAILFIAYLSEVEGKKKKGLKIKKPKKMKVKKIKVNKKVKRFFAVKKKHHHHHASSTTSSFTPTLSMISPTMTTFTSFAVTPTPIIMTITDRNFNYFFGYAATVSGVQYYNSPKFMVAGPRRCGCADSHPIVVTRYDPEDIGI